MCLLTLPLVEPFVLRCATTFGLKSNFSRHLLQTCAVNIEKQLRRLRVHPRASEHLNVNTRVAGPLWFTYIVTRNCALYSNDLRI